MSESQPLPLSVVIVTNRGDDRFEACLKSVAWAAEIIIVDDSSGCEWSSLKNRFPLKIITLDTPLTDFAAARNHGLEHASHEWVLMVDSDEVVTPASLPSLKEIIASNAEGAMVKRTDVFLGKALKWGEVRNVQILRLGKKAHFRFERPIHEVGVIKGKVVDSDIELFHYSHPSVSDFFKSIVRHSYREADFRIAQGQKTSLLELIFYPLAKAVYNGIIKAGLLDGGRGLVYIVMMSLHSLLVRVFMYEKTHV